MDVAAYLRRFESSLSSYTGDDPLDPWDRFVQFLEQKLPAGGSSMSLVFDTLVQRFLNVDRYANDPRFVNYCIRCAGYYSDPVALYSEIFNKGVGVRAAVLYVAWAQHFEQKGMNQQADAVYQKALENRAQPADTVLSEYRQFQSRTRTQLPVSGARTPLQNSQLTNQESADSVGQNKVSDCPSKPPANRTVVIVSRSETSGSLPSSQSSSVQAVPEYMKDQLLCGGSEVCFEEVRAEKYFHKLRLRQEKEQREAMEKNLKEQEDKVQRMKDLLDQINQGLEACGGLSSQSSSQQPPALQTSSNPPQTIFTCPRPSNHLSSRRSLGLRFHTDPTFIQEATTIPDLPQQSGASEVSQHASVLPDRRADPESVTRTSMVQRPVSSDQMNVPLIRPADLLHPGAQVQLSGSEASGPAEHSVAHLDGGQIPESEEKLDVSHGGTANVSHITPNNSLGFVQATPSRVLPSPTVNTREALGVIMDMFQAPTFLEEPFSSSSVLRAPQDFGLGSDGAPPPSTPFTIYQDHDKENCSAAGPSQKSRPVRPLTDINLLKVDKPNETSPDLIPDLIPDESTMWGARYNSLNSLAACPNSTTDFAMLAQFVSTPFTHKTLVTSNLYQDQEMNCDGDEGEEKVFIRRQTKQLSPIMEQSPSEDQLLPPSVRQGTLVGEGLTSTTSISTMVQPPPPAALSFRDQTDFSRSAGPGWEVYTSPEQPPKPDSLVSVRPKAESFMILQDVDQPTSSEPDQNLVCDVPMSPECSLKPNWLDVRSPEVGTERDLDAFLSPRRPQNADTSSMKTLDVPMSPDQLQLSANAPMSPRQVDPVDEPMTSPDRDLRLRTRLISDPWDSNLISHLLGGLSPPLTSHPRCFTWQRDVPPITPRTTISMGKASLRIDGVLGEGAFATVYQATDPMTSEKMVLKVQKPANPWEFYIITCLDSRLRPDRRHLYGAVRSAHLFHDGSVLLGELHNYGTLLNVVNLYRTLSDRVMPQPLVLYFSVCLLHMVEQLHAVHVVHADIKPDNFMLGQRFLENEHLDPESSDQGLVLIDLGQSIDMDLFPEGTAFTARCLTSGFQCTEMLSGKPWNYQTDYFGLAGTVYCMLFGTYMKVTNTDGVWRTSGVFRRNPHSALWLEFFDTLLNVPDCESQLDLQNLRSKMSSVLQQNYSNKLPSLKRRLVVQLLEAHKAARR